MKRILKISLVLTVMLLSNLTFSNNHTFTTPSEARKVIYVTFNNVKSGSILSLLNEDDFIMYSVTIDETGPYSKQFDFTLLPEGTYTFEMETAFEVTVKPLTVSSKEVAFLKDQEKTFFKPVLKLKDHSILISQLALNEKPLKVSLFYSEDHTEEVKLYSGVFQGNQKYTIEKVLALSKTHPGTYRIVLSTNDHVYIETFKF